MKKNIVKISENTLKQIVAESIKKIIKEGVVGPGDPNYDVFLQKLHDYQKECERIDAEFKNSLTPEEKEYISQGGNWLGKWGRELELRKKKGLTRPPRPTYERGKSNYMSPEQARANGFKKTENEINEGAESDGYEYGIEPDYALRRGFEGTKEKGKNYFANNGIVNFGFNKTPERQIKVYITTCFLANRRLAGKLGAKWGTAASKRIFNAYTVDSDSILAVIEDRGNNNIFQVQIKDGKPVMAADANDNVVDLKKNYKYGTILMQLRHYFKWNLEATKKMTAEEDEFFAGKTSKTYDRLR